MSINYKEGPRGTKSAREGDKVQMVSYILFCLAVIFVALAFIFGYFAPVQTATTNGVVSKSKPHATKVYLLDEGIPFKSQMPQMVFLGRDNKIRLVIETVKTKTIEAEIVGADNKPRMSLQWHQKALCSSDYFCQTKNLPSSFISNQIIMHNGPNFKDDQYLVLMKLCSKKCQIQTAIVTAP